MAPDIARRSEYLEPEEEIHGRYLEHFELFKAVYADLRDDFLRLRGLVGSGGSHDILL